MKRFLLFIALLLGVIWWAWIPMVFGIWNHDEDYPEWIRNIIYTVFGIHTEPKTSSDETLEDKVTKFIDDMTSEYDSASTNERVEIYAKFYRKGLTEGSEWEKEQLLGFYRDAIRGTYPSRIKFIEFMETMYPDLKTKRLTEKAEMYLRCLNTLLRQFNPKMDTDESWIYFKEEGRKIYASELYAFFENTCRGVIEDSKKLVNKSEYEKR